MVYHQTTEDFLRCLENAFWYFGGVPQTLVLDGLKVAVPQADWRDPDVHPEIQSLCQHYGTVTSPTRIYLQGDGGKCTKQERTLAGFDPIVGGWI